METADDLNTLQPTGYNPDDLQDNVDVFASGGEYAVKGAEMGSAFGPWGTVIGAAAGYIGGTFYGEAQNKQIARDNRKVHEGAYGSNREQQVAVVDPMVSAQIPGRVQSVGQPAEVNPATGTTEPPKPSVNGKAFSPVQSGGTLDTTFDPSIAQFGTVT